MTAVYLVEYGFEPVGSGSSGHPLHDAIAVGYIYRHDVSEPEIEDVLRRPIEDRPGREGSRVALGRTQAGRYLRVIYVPDPVPDSVFVVTAYRLGPKAVRALRRRRRRRQ
jgi:Domain of unknown function (DUF4258)